MKSDDVRSRWTQAAHFALATLLAASIAVFYVKRSVDHRAGDRSRLFLLGTMFSQPGANAAGAYVREGPGYDGQFVLRIAIDPLTKAKTDHGITLDKPPYRHQRIVLPVLAHVLSGGNDVTLTWLIPALNVAFFGLLAGMGTLVAHRRGRHPAAGAVLFAGWPGFATTLVRNLTELLAALLFLIGLFFLERSAQTLPRTSRDRSQSDSRGGALVRRSERTNGFVSTVALSLALLSRETFVIPLAVIGCVVLLQRIRYRVGTGLSRRVPLHTLLVPGIVLGVWQAALWANWRQSTFQSTRGRDLGLPFVGVSHALKNLSWRDGLSRGQTLSTIALFVLVVAALGTVATGRRFRTTTTTTTVSCDHVRSTQETLADAALTAAFLVSLGFLLSLSDLVWVEDYAWARVSTDVAMLGSFVLLRSRRTKLSSFAILAVGVAFCVATAVAGYSRMISAA